MSTIYFLRHRFTLIYTDLPVYSQITCIVNKTDNIFTFRAICSFFAQSLLGRVYALPLYLSAHARSSPAHRYDTGCPRTTSHPGSAQASFVLLLLLYSFFLFYALLKLCLFLAKIIDNNPYKKAFSRTRRYFLAEVKKDYAIRRESDKANTCKVGEEVLI